jgi:hypothetical protein
MKGAAVLLGVTYLLLLVALAVGFGELVGQALALLPPGWARAVGLLAWVALGLPALLLCALVALTIVFFFWDDG